MVVNANAFPTHYLLPTTHWIYCVRTKIGEFDLVMVSLRKIHARGLLTVFGPYKGDYNGKPARTQTPSSNLEQSTCEGLTFTGTGSPWLKHQFFESLATRGHMGEQ